MATPTITAQDIQSWIQGLQQNDLKGSTTPYENLSESQTSKAMASLGYTQSQIKSAMNGSDDGSSIARALSGVSQSVAALGPEAAPFSDLLDLIPGVSEAANAAAGKASDLPADAGADTADSAAQAAEDAEDYGSTKDDSRSKEDDDDDDDSKSRRRSAHQPSTSLTLDRFLADLLGDAKYAAIWVGLIVMGIALILIGLSKSGAKPPAILPVVAP